MATKVVQPCSIEGCGRPMKAKGLCSTHDQRMRRRGTLELSVHPLPDVCMVEGCAGQPRSRGWCNMHYTRMMRTGTIESSVRDAAERFFEKVDKGGPVPACRPDLGPCWMWTGGTSQGYGRFSIRHATAVNAHRWSYEYAGREIPEGLDLDHLCRVRCCVNPDHLEPVTRGENVSRGFRSRKAGW